MDRWLSELESFLEQLQAEHEALLKAMHAKRAAIAAARPNEVAEWCRRENEHVQKIGAIEKRRQLLVGQLTEHLQPDAGRPMRLTELAAQAKPEQRQRLVELHGRLRQTIKAVANEAAIARKATAGLLRHVQGVMGLLDKAFASLGTYGRKGIEVGPTAAVSSFTAVG